MSDPEGRWFSFNIDLNAVVLLERKGTPQHLQGLPCVDNATDLATVLRELEDSGEVPSFNKNKEFTLYFIYLFNHVGNRLNPMMSTDLTLVRSSLLSATIP